MNQTNLRLIIPLLLVGSLCLVFTLFNGNQGSERTPNQHLQLQSNNDVTAPIRNESRQAFVTRVTKERMITKLKRGENNTLILPSASIEKKERHANKTFAEKAFRFQHKLEGHLAKDEHTLVANEFTYDPEVIERFVASNASSLVLPLTDGREVLLEVDRVISRGEHTHTLVGRIGDDSFSDAIVVAHDGTFSGSVSFRNKNEHYNYSEAGNGYIAVRQLDPTSYKAPCGNVGDEMNLVESLENNQQDENGEEAGEEDEGGGASSSPSPSADQLITMDSVIGYGAAARASQGGTAAIEALIVVGADRLNTALGNSLINGIQYNLRGMIEDPDYVFPGAVNDPADDPTMGSGDELGNLDDENDGVLDAVTNLKNTLNADHAGFVVQDVDGSAGVAYRPGDSMIVARTYISPTRLTFAHEFGHNLGSHHAWGDTANDSNKEKHNFGWRIKHSGGTQVRTIMAYDWGWTRIPYFANPNVLYNGSRTGAVDGYDATGDTTADPRAVNNGLEGSQGAGYDGTNSLLGARNADFIANHAISMANRQTRPLGDIAVEEPTLDGDLVCGEGIVNFNSTGVGNNPIKTFTIINRGTSALSGLTVALSGEHSAEFSVSSLSTTTLSAGATTTVNVTFTPTTTQLRSAMLRVTSDDIDEAEFDINLSGGMRAQLQYDTFDAGLGNWSNSTGYDFNWTRDNNGTGSVGTGPSAAQTSPNEPSNSHYMYTEATGNSPTKRAALETAIDLTGKEGAVLSFIYHMYGERMGVLHVDIYDGTEWNEAVYTIGGSRHTANNSQWSYMGIDLSEYSDTSGVQIRFRGVTGESFTSDIAIDSVRLEAADISLTPYQSWAQNNGLTGADALTTTVLKDDGITNLVKFAFNLDPNANQYQILETGGTSGNPRFFMNSDANPKLSVEFIRRKDSPNLTYVVQFSDIPTGGAWTTVGAQISVTSIDTQYERVVVEDLFDTSQKTRRFGRIKITE